jgi:acryloyl-coenzyme A reductase
MSLSEATMKAITFHTYGASDVLTYEDVSVPVPARDEALIAVRSVAVNRGLDIQMRSGRFGMGGQVFPHIGGADPSGEIVELGADVTNFKIGARVAVHPVIACGQCDVCMRPGLENRCRQLRLFGIHTPGGRAEFVCASASQLVRLPDSVSYEAAAALGLAYLLAWHGIVDRALLTEEDCLLVVGAGGSCGVAAVQIGKLLGARVIAATGQPWKHERLLELGADAVVSYRDPEWPAQARAASGRHGPSVVFDNGGASTLAASLDCIDIGGRLLCSGATGGTEVTLDIRRMYGKHLSVLCYAAGTRQDLAQLLALTHDRRLDPVIDRQYPLAQAAAADDHLQAGDHFGRVVLTIDPALAKPTA